jgi:hypothetical protein
MGDIEKQKAESRKHKSRTSAAQNPESTQSACSRIPPGFMAIFQWMA